MMRTTSENPVAPTDIFFTYQSHRYYLQVMKRALQQHTSVVITHEDARVMVPHRLADNAMRVAILSGFFGTLIAIWLLWAFYLSHVDNLMEVILGSAVLVVLGIWGTFFYYEFLLERFFFGTVLQGVVVRSATLDDKHYTLTYEFTTPAGLLRTETLKGAWAKTDAFSIPPPGTPIALYHIDDNRFWLL
jgi:hypothetical protein